LGTFRGRGSLGNKGTFMEAHKKKTHFFESRGGLGKTDWERGGGGTRHPLRPQAMSKLFW